eukprot:EG_transcript_27955
MDAGESLQPQPSEDRPAPWLSAISADWPPGAPQPTVASLAQTSTQSCGSGAKAEPDFAPVPLPGLPFRPSPWRRHLATSSPSPRPPQREVAEAPHFAPADVTSPPPL